VTQNNSKNVLYFGRDPREVPTYTLQDTAHYTSVPLNTLRSWLTGRKYPTTEGTKHSKPLILRPDKKTSLLSFTNLVEIHVLDAIRRKHQVPMYKVRAALDYVEKRFNSLHPLAEQTFETNGIDLFVDKYGELINASRQGQLGIRELLKEHLERIEHDAQGLAKRLYPFGRMQKAQTTRMVVIDAFVSFGKPVLVGTGIPTSIIAERWETGESIAEIAADYERSDKEIEEALRYELKAA
jgi:uncharacterized protein (DUF433 family)